MKRTIFLISNLAVIAACPVYASPLSEFAKAHDVEFIVAGCLAIGVLGTVGRMLTKL